MNKKYIVKENTEFNEIINKGKKISNNEFIIFFKHKNELSPKFGITAPKKIGNAVIRNKCKRQVRNIIHSNNLLFKNYNNYIIIIKKGFLLNSFQQNKLSLINLLGGINEN
ncbi:MAG: ribonuclease P protein component [Bacilli bacterium]